MGNVLKGEGAGGAEGKQPEGKAGSGRGEISSAAANAVTRTVERTLSEVISVFTELYSEYFKMSMVEYLLSHSADQGGIVAARLAEQLRELDECPPLAHTLRTGYMEKRGDVNKLWRRRWFVARNSAHNYWVEYFDSHSSTKCRGVIEASHYTLARFTEQEAQSYGARGFKLVPTHFPEGRVWYLRCTRDGEVDIWIALFDHIIRKTELASTSFYGEEDALMGPTAGAAAAQESMVTNVEINNALRRSFHLATHSLRMRFGVTDWSISFDRGAQLDIVTHLAKMATRHALAGTLASIDDAQDRAAAATGVEAAVEFAIENTLIPGWRGLASTLAALRSAYLTELSQKFTMVHSAHSRARARITENVEETVGQAIAICTETRCVPFVNASAEPVATFTFQCLQAFAQRLFDKLTAVQSERKRLADVVADAQRDIDMFAAQSLHTDAETVFHEFMHSELRESCSFVTPDIAHEYYGAVLDGVRQLMHDAVFSLSQRSSRDTLVRNGGSLGSPTLPDGDPDYVRIFATLLPDLAHDAKLAMEASVLRMVLTVAGPGIDVEVIQNLTAANTSTAEACLPAEIKAFLDPSIATELTLCSIVRSYLLDTVRPALHRATESGESRLLGCAPERVQEYVYLYAESKGHKAPGRKRSAVLSSSPNSERRSQGPFISPAEHHFPENRGVTRAMSGPVLLRAASGSRGDMNRSRGRSRFKMSSRRPSSALNSRFRRPSQRPEPAENDINARVGVLPPGVFRNDDDDNEEEESKSAATARKARATRRRPTVREPAEENLGLFDGP